MTIVLSPIDPKFTLHIWILLNISVRWRREQWCITRLWWPTCSGFRPVGFARDIFGPVLRSEEIISSSGAIRNISELLLEIDSVHGTVLCYVVLRVWAFCKTQITYGMAISLVIAVERNIHPDRPRRTRTWPPLERQDRHLHRLIMLYQHHPQSYPQHPPLSGRQ